jgi:glucosamine--fructose-6-phosphate aminotransferase (isomerizing)
MAWAPAPARFEHPYHMHDAIYAQPGALRLVMRPNGDAVAGAAERLRAMDHVILTGIGTSWHATLVGELLLARAGGLGYRARALHAFELASYWPAPGPRAGTVVVSHHGSRGFAVEALARAGASGGTSVAVTGKGADGLATADFTLRTVERESSGAHTVGYTCALALLAAVAAEIGGSTDLARGLNAIPDHVALLLGQESWEELAARFRDRQRYYFVGGGPNTATAYEAALKMSEAAHVTALGYGCEQFLHGVYAALDAGDLVVLVAPPGPSYARCLTVARVAREIGAPVVALVEEGDREIAALAAETIAIPALDELLSPIVTVVPLQLFTYHTALARRVNPDATRGDEAPHARARALVSL